MQAFFVEPASADCGGTVPAVDLDMSLEPQALDVAGVHYTPEFAVIAKALLLTKKHLLPDVAAPEEKLG